VTAAIEWLLAGVEGKWMWCSWWLSNDCGLSSSTEKSELEIIMVLERLPVEFDSGVCCPGSDEAACV
jgi:hypothetical protein